MHLNAADRPEALNRAPTSGPFPAAAPTLTGTERIATTVCLASVVVGVVIAGLGTFEAVPVVVGLLGVGLFIASAAGLVVIGVRGSRRGDPGILRSIGRAVGRVVKHFV